MKNKVNMLKKKWLEVLTILLAVIALFFSWQANTITSKQVTPQVTLLSSGPFKNRIEKGGYDWSGFNWCELFEEEIPNRPRMVCGSYIACLHQIRIANLGGASTALVNFSGKISYGDYSRNLDGNDKSTITTYDINDPFKGSAIKLLEFSIAKNLYVAIEKIPNEYLLSMPTQVEEYSVMDILGITFYTLNDNLYRVKEDISLSQELLDKSQPVLISYDLEFSSGKTLSTPYMPCGLVTEKE